MFELIEVQCDFCGGHGWDPQDGLPCAHCEGTGCASVERRGVAHGQDVEKR